MKSKQFGLAELKLQQTIGDSRIVYLKNVLKLSHSIEKKGLTTTHKSGILNYFRVELCLVKSGY